jgi:hypothetical protein
VRCLPPNFGPFNGKQASTFRVRLANVRQGSSGGDERPADRHRPCPAGSLRPGHAPAFYDRLDSVPKMYLQSMIEVVELTTIRIWIKGSKDVGKAVLTAAVLATKGSRMSTKWRTRHDSNV